MPQAGVSARARRRYAAPWWGEELDREAFRFPAASELKPVARESNGTSGLSAQDGNGSTPARVRVTPSHATPVRAARPVRAATSPRAAIALLPAEEPEPTGPAVSAEPVRWASSTAGPTPGSRRTVTIRGHGAERNLQVARPTLRRHERPGFRPDRAALWAVILGLVLILVAVASAHGAVVH